MFLLLVSTIIFGLLTVVSLLISYYVTIMMNESASDDPPRVNSVIMTQTALLIQVVVNAFGDLLTLITSSFFEFVSNIRENLKTYLNLFLLASIFIAYITNKESFLTNVDQFWRCAIQPLFVNIILVILQVGRVLWGALIPLYNYQTVITSQVLDGTRVIYTKCNYISLFDTLKMILNLVLSMFSSIVSWSGAIGEMSVENNLVTNELDIRRVVINLQKLVIKQREVSDCLCEGLGGVSEFFFILFRQDELATAINHFINIPISLIQTSIQIIPPWSNFPDGVVTFNHVQGFVYYAAKYMDLVLMKWVVNLIALFDDNLRITGLPEEFFLTIGARYFLSSLHFVYTILRIVSALAIPMGKTFPTLMSADHMLKVFAMDQVMEHYNLAVIASTDILAWFLKLQHAFTIGLVVNAVKEAEQLLVMPSHVHIDCDLKNAYDWITQEACAARIVAMYGPDMIYLVYTMLVEILWKVLVHKEEAIIPLFQRYDGISFPRSVELTCDYRKSITYDLTAGECRCDPGLGTLHYMVKTTENPFGSPYYDRYCGQPNLQVNYFAAFERAQKYLAYGAYENIKEITSLLALSINEYYRMLLKGVLNLENIFSGDYFMYKVNCGYGLSSKQLRTWFNETDRTNTLSEKIENHQTASCRGDLMAYVNDIDGTMRCKLIDSVIRDLMCIPTANAAGRTILGMSEPITTPKCKGVNKAGCECNWVLANYCNGHTTNGVDDSTSIRTEAHCTDVYAGGTWTVGTCSDTTITTKAECTTMDQNTGIAPGEWTDGDCTGQNINGTLVNSTSKEHCEKVTTAGIWRGAIPSDNKCQCIRSFPDTVMEYVQGPWENQVLTRFHAPDVSLHWCNTFWAAWYLYYIDKYAYVVENVLAILHPAYKPADDGTNPYCEASTFTVYETTVLNYPLWRFNQDKDVYDQLQLSYDRRSCDAYGTTDMICSLGMTLRNSVRLVVNEARVLSIAASQVIEFDFSQIKITLSERICDLARSFSALASVIPAILPDAAVNKQFQQGMSQLIYSVLNIVIVALDTINHILVFIQDLITGNLDWSLGPAGPFFQLIFGLINVWIDAIRVLLQALGNMLNSIQYSGGDAILTIDNMIGMLQKYLINEASMELIGLIVKIGTQFVEMLVSGSVEDIGQFFSDLWSLITKAFMIILKNAAKVLSLIMDALGPVGDFIRLMANSICSAIEDAICAITLGGTCDIGCISLRHSERRHLFSSGNSTSKFQDILFHTTNDINWNGTSGCDLFMHSYKHYKWDDLRPLEHIFFMECLEQRHIVAGINKVLNTSIPEDFIYNWKRKWIMGKIGMEGLIIYIHHRVGSITTKQMLHQFKEKNIPYQEVLGILNYGTGAVRSTFTISTAKKFIEQTFREFDPNIEKGTGVASHVYRLADIASRAGTDIYNHAKKKKFHAQLQKTMATIYEHAPRAGITMPTFKAHFPNHLKHSFESWHKTRAGPNLHVKSRNFVLRAAGLVTDITPCDQREDNFVCINCVILDNLLNVIIRDGIRMSNYYTDIYAPVTIPSFVQFWTNNTEAQAWREDAGKSLSSAFKKSSINLNMDINASINHANIDIPPGGSMYIKLDGMDAYQGYDSGIELERRRLYSNNTYSNQTLNFFKRARRDWAWFFKTGWNPLKDHTLDPDGRPTVFMVLIQFLAGGEDEYCAYFAHTFKYYILRVFPRACPMDKIYCEYNTFDERQRLIGDAFIYILYMLLGMFILQYQFGLPLTAYLGFFMPLIALWIYNYTVYDYTLYCTPNLPNCWVEDFFTFVHDTLLPTCFCYYFPGLSKNCNPDSCFLCSRSTEFHSCVDKIPLFNDMGILWAPAFWVRKNYPSMLVTLYKTIPFAWFIRNYTPLVTMTQYIIEGIEIEQIELDCLILSYIDIGMVFLGTWFIVKFLSIIVPVMIRGFQHALNIFTIMVTIIYSMALSLEIQTTSGINTEYESEGI